MPRNKLNPITATHLVVVAQLAIILTPSQHEGNVADILAAADFPKTRNQVAGYGKGLEATDQNDQPKSVKDYIKSLVEADVERRIIEAEQEEERERLSGLPVLRDCYDLYLTHDGRPMLMKFTESRLLLAGSVARIMVADLQLASLRPVTKSDLLSFQHYLKVLKWDWLTESVSVIRAFMQLKGSHEGPYYGALSFATPKKVFHLRSRSRESINDATRVERDYQITILEHDNYHLVSADVSEDDKELIDGWVKSQRATRGARQRLWSLIESMLCARTAEKLVIAFYAKFMNIAAEDVSLQQLRNLSSLWKHCDVVANGTYIDVKNCVHRRKYTPQVFVRRFKSIASDPIAIAAVETQNWERTTKQVFLGAVTLDKLHEVQRSINELPDRGDKILFPFDDQRLPPWSFELPDDILDHDQFFSLAKLFSCPPETALAAAIACGRERESELYDGFKADEKRIVDLFSMSIKAAGFSKATIAMFAMSEFLSRCRTRNGASSFIRFFRKLVSFEEIQTSAEVDISIEQSLCGGLHDPTDSISGLLDLLQKCGEGIERQPSEFVYLNMLGTHLLTGKTTADETITIYAICGGKQENGDNCRKFPLVIGSNLNCDDCGKLICDICKFCEDGCDRCYGRDPSETSGWTGEDVPDWLDY